MGYADKKLRVSSCTSTGSVTISPPYPQFSASIALGATSPLNIATFASFTVNDVITGCSTNPLGYQLNSNGTLANYLKYRKKTKNWR